MNDLAKGDGEARRLASTRRYLPLALTLCVGVLVSVVASIMVRGWEQERIKVEFERQAGILAAASKSRFGFHLEVLHSIGSFFPASNFVDRREFAEFVKQPLSVRPGIQALEWVPRVPDAERPAFEAAARKDGHADFRFTERNTQAQMVKAARREDYFPVYYLEPMKGNEAALGFDLASEPARLNALARARDTGKAAATGRITLVQETGKQYGVLVFMPIYRKGMRHDTLAERRESLHGFALGVFRIGDLVEASLRGLDRSGIDVHLYDRSAEAAEQFLYETRSPQRTMAAHPIVDEIRRDSRAPHWGETLDVGGRQWSLLFLPVPEYLAARTTWQTWGVLGGGLLFTALLGAYMFTVLGRTAQVERLVKERTAELAKANEHLARQIAERDRAEEALKESEKRYRTLLEASADAVIVYDARGHVTYLNPAFQRTFGWSQEDLLGRRIEFVPEENRQETKVAIERLRLAEQVVGFETRRRTKQGTLLDVLVSASPLQDADGKYAGAFVTFRDISDRKRAEEVLTRRTRQLQALRDIAVEITRELDLNRLLAVIVRRAMELFEAPAGAVWLWDEDADVLRPAAWHGVEDWIREVRVRLGEGLAGMVAKRREGMIANDYRTWTHASPLFLERTSLSAFMGEPLLYRDRLVGVLVVAQVSRSFSEQDRETLALFAPQVAIAIENARLYTEAHRREKEVTQLYEITAELASSLDLDRVLDRVTAMILELLGSEASGIYMYDETRKGLTFFKGLNLDPELTRDLVLAPGEGVAGRAFEERRPVWTNDRLADPSLHYTPASDKLVKEKAPRAYLAVPIMSRAQVYGALVDYYFSPHEYTSKEIQLLSTLAQQAAVAIENARLHLDLRESKGKIEELYTLGVTMQEQMSLEKRLGLILTGAQAVLGFDRINILLPDPEMKMLKAVASVGVEEPLESIRVPLGPEGGGIAKAFLDRTEIVWEGLGSVPEEWRLGHPYSEIQAFRSKAFVNVPLIVGGRPIGVLGADNKATRKPISAERVRLLRTFAAQAALAIDNARLYEEVTGQAKELERKVEERTKALKETQVQLIQSGKLAAVGTLAAGVAHELNQPLMVIRGYAQELLDDERIADPEFREDLSRIEAQTTRMTAIINHLRDFSRQSKGTRQRTDLNQVVTQAFGFLDQQLRTRNIQVVQALDPALPSVWADPLQIEQILLNLVTNARDAMEKVGKGVIIIRTEQAGDARVALSVTDTGPGIPPDLKARIFDPFFTTKEVGKGTGLGLSICHGIAEEHGGELRVESPVAEDRGACFTLMLPRSLRDASGGERG